MPTPTPRPHRYARQGALIAVAAITLTAATVAGWPTTAMATPSSQTPSPVSATATTPVPSDVPALPNGWVETPLQFTTAWGTIHATYTHPLHTRHRLPATLIIGGSGPTDRDGNDPAGKLTSADTLLTVSRWLAQDGQASLRYDKLGSGQTGLGNRPLADYAHLSFTDVLTINAQALTTLAHQPGVNRHRINVIGHSEGGLFALALADGMHGTARHVPHVHAIATLEGLPIHFLDLLRIQVAAQLEQAVTAGTIPAAAATQTLAQVDQAIMAIRAGGSAPTDLQALLPAINDTYVRTEDAVDPRLLAARLPRHMPVLMTCSTGDIQVTCGEAAAMFTAARRADHRTRTITLTQTDHMLKLDPTHTNYNADLPFSPQLQTALGTWTRH